MRKIKVGKRKRGEKGRKKKKKKKGSLERTSLVDKGHFLDSRIEHARESCRDWQEKEEEVCFEAHLLGRRWMEKMLPVPIS